MVLLFLYNYKSIPQILYLFSSPLSSNHWFHFPSPAPHNCSTYNPRPTHLTHPTQHRAPRAQQQVTMENIKSYNVARKYEKRALLIAVNLVAGLSIFFFGYDQGVMGGVNGNRDYARTMGFGDFNSASGIVDVKKPLLQGGIVSNPKIPTLCWACVTYLVSVALDRSLLPSRHSLRLFLRRLVRRSIRSYLNHCRSLHLGYRRRNPSMLRPRRQVDVLRSCPERYWNWYPERHNPCLGHRNR